MCQLSKLTSRNLNIGYEAFFAAEFVWYNSQICNSLQDVIPEFFHLLRTLELTNNM